MSLPPIGRPTGGLPPRSGNPSAPPQPTRRSTREEAAEAPVEPASEVLIITVEPDKDDPSNLAVIFEGAGFDIENDQIILDIIDLAARTYGYKIVQEDDDE